MALQREDPGDSSLSQPYNLKMGKLLAIPRRRSKGGFDTLPPLRPGNPWRQIASPKGVSTGRPDRTYLMSSLIEMICRLGLNSREACVSPLADGPLARTLCRGMSYTLRQRSLHRRSSSSSSNFPCACKNPCSGKEENYTMYGRRNSRLCSATATEPSLSAAQLVSRFTLFSGNAVGNTWIMQRPRCK